jgi:hypothetical protein
MFSNDPVSCGYRPWRPWRPWSIPSFLVAAVVLAWLLRYGGLLSSLAEWFLEPDGDTALELPNDLVLARLPWSYTWSPDFASDGVQLLLMEESELGGRALGIERWSRPWKEGKREPIPAAWRAATPANWQNDTGMVGHFGFNSPITRDGRLLATYHPSEGSGQTRIIALPGGKELARVDAIPSGPNGKDLAWHPTENVLVIGSYGSVTLASAPDWKPRKLATAARDRLEWERRVQAGDEESGYHPSENVTQLVFSDDGAFLIAAMDRGMRVYDWPAVRQAIDRLPAPRYAVDGVLVHRPIASFKMTYAVAHDPRRQLVLWAENDGKLKFLRLTTGQQGTLLALTNRYSFVQLYLCAAGDALVAQVHRLGKSGNGPGALVVLDYPKLLQRGGVEPLPEADARAKN